MTRQYLLENYGEELFENIYGGLHIEFTTDLIKDLSTIIDSSLAGLLQDMMREGLNLYLPHP